MKLNELLKKYRTEQNKTQKQWAQDVVSPSFYAKVEKNLSRISAEDLIDLLHNNKVSVLEFFSKLNQNEHSTRTQKSEINRLINEAYYTNSQEELHNLRDTVEKGHLANKEDELLLIDTCIALNKGDTSKINKQIVEDIKDKVFDINDFEENDAMLYCSLMNFYDIDTNLIISRRAIEQFIGSTSVVTQQLVLSIIINMLIICIQNKEFTETKFFQDSAKQIKINPNIFFYKLVISGLQNIIAHYKTNKPEYLDKAKKIIHTINLAGMTFYAQKLTKLLENIEEK